MEVMNEKIFSAKDMYDALAFKQKLCKRELKEKNSCHYGYNCHFAHSFDEMQFNKNLSEKVNRYIHEKMAEEKVKKKREDKNFIDEEYYTNQLKKLEKDLEDIKYINQIILKSNNKMEKMVYEFQNNIFNDPKDIYKSIEDLEENSNKIKNRFKKFDSRKDARNTIKRFRENSESPVHDDYKFKRSRSVSNESLNKDLDEYINR